MPSVMMAHPQEDATLLNMMKRILFCPSEERIARELHQLPPNHRQQVWADMAGHAETIDYRLSTSTETPALIQDRLNKLNQILQEQLNKSPALPQSPRPDTASSSFHAAHSATAATSLEGVDGRPAFLLAVQQDPEWVERQKLACLRCENFEAPAAAVRCLRYFALKHWLFLTDRGNMQDPSILGRDVTLQDMSPDDLESLAAGGMQFLSHCDHAGRGIIFTRTRNYKYKHRTNMLRAFFYTAQCATRDEKLQKIGFISVSYNVLGGYPSQGYDFELTRQVGQLVKAFPLRFCAIYVCYDNSAWKAVADLISHLLSPILRVRLRSIQGSHQECLYQLYALGIPIQAIPLINSGENRLDYLHRWIEDQRRCELQQKTGKLNVIEKE